MFDALDEDGGAVDLGEFIGKVTERIAEVTRDDAPTSVSTASIWRGKGSSSSRM